MKRILVTTNEIWCRTAIVSSGQMGRVHGGAASFHTSKIRVSHTLLAFNAVIEMKRLINGMVFVSLNANERDALCAASSSSHLQSLTEVSALNLTTKHPLGLCSFHLRHSTFLPPSDYYLASVHSFSPPICSICRYCMMTQSWKFCKSSLPTAILSFKNNIKKTNMSHYISTKNDQNFEIYAAVLTWS